MDSSGGTTDIRDIIHSHIKQSTRTIIALLVLHKVYLQDIDTLYIYSINSTRKKHPVNRISQALLTLPALLSSELLSSLYTPARVPAAGYRTGYRAPE